jgi:transcriptional regulator
MYHPASFREDSLEAQHGLIRQAPFATLVTASPTGLLADHLPFILTDGGQKGVLRGHLAKANPQMHALAQVTECLVIFQGPESYITPNWYPTRETDGRVAPTWNYVAVHAWGRPVIRDDREWLRAQIAALIAQMESGQETPWAMSQAPTDYVEGLLGGIFGIEIEIARIEGKWKVSQNQPEVNRTGVIQGLCAAGDEDMARLVESRAPKR